MKAILAGLFLLLAAPTVASFTPLLAAPTSARWTLRGMVVVPACVGLAMLWRMYTSSMSELSTAAGPPPAPRDAEDVLP